MKHDLNLVVLLGTVGADPVVRYTSIGPNTTFSMVTNHWRKGEGGQVITLGVWHTVLCWKRTAEVAGMYVVKGRRVCVEGRLHYQHWTKDGVKKKRTVVIAKHIILGEHSRRALREAEAKGQAPGGEE